MSRVQLALNVADIDEAVAFYSKLFATEPAKRRPGYANFAIAEPPLKLVLIENAADAGSLNHLGVEVASTDAVTAATSRLSGEGLATDVEEQVSCCYAVQDKVWVSGPDGERWEVYTVLADADTFVPVASNGADDGVCCGGAAVEATPVTVGAPKTCC